MLLRMRLRCSRWIVFLLLSTVLPVAKAASKGTTPQLTGVAERTFHPTAPRDWRKAQHQALRCLVWYPAVSGAAETERTIDSQGVALFTAGRAAVNAPLDPAGKWPLVVLSPGNGSAASQMAWLGEALAHDGMIAVAVDHPGDNADEPLTPEGLGLWWERATDLSNVIDAMLSDAEFGPHIDERMIGAAGYDLGGYTVLELAGARTDISVMEPFCHDHPAAVPCHIPELPAMTPGQTLFARLRKTSGISLAQSDQSFRDPRVRSVLVLAPTLGFTLTPDSLHSIHLPVEIISAAHDEIAPAADNAEYLRANIHNARQVVLPGEVAHNTFLDVCTAAGKAQVPQLCTDPPSVSREAVHDEVGNLAVEFFSRTLKWK